MGIWSLLRCMDVYVIRSGRVGCRRGKPASVAAD
jgi:hypothetical protein